MFEEFIQWLTFQSIITERTEGAWQDTHETEQSFVHLVEVVTDFVFHVLRVCNHLFEIVHSLQLPIYINSFWSISYDLSTYTSNSFLL